MDTNYFITFFQESLFTILVFGAFLTYSILRGRQSLINLILGLYFALLITLKFPYFELILGGANGNPRTESILMIAVFLVFTIGSTILFTRLMPEEYSESSFEGLGKKFLFALVATILVLAYSYHALPVTDLVTPSSPIQSLFAPPENFFWWLLAPILALFLL